MMGTAMAYIWAKPSASLTVARNDSNRWVVPQSQLIFSQTAIDSIILYRQDSAVNVTVDHSCRNGSTEGRMDCQYYASTLPGAHFDLDDDGKDGYSEEAEVTILGTPVAGTQYTFTTRFVRASGEYSGTIQLNLQHSFRNYVTGEYDTVLGTSSTVDWKN